LLAAALSMSLGCSPARSETREQWIEWGAKVHGPFGTFIPVGIRIGVDAKDRRTADARGLTVVYSSGAKPPHPFNRLLKYRHLGFKCRNSNHFAICCKFEHSLPKRVTAY